MHVPLEAAELLPYVPKELELDMYDGKAWISIFPFKVKKSSI